MPRDRSDQTYLLDMLAAAENVVGFIADRTFEDYSGDLMLRSAVERQIEIIGEAARHISDAFQQEHAHVPWRKIMAQRHILAHEYAEIQHDLIWKVASLYVPELVVLLRPLIETPKDEA